MSRRGWFAVSLSLSPEFAAQSPLVSSPSLPRGGGVLVDGRTLTAAAARLVDEALQRHDADGDGALSPKELDAFNLSCGGGALEADDLVFLLDSFEVDAPSGGLYYPGSPVLAALLSRPQDRLTLVERERELFAEALPTDALRGLPRTFPRELAAVSFFERRKGGCLAFPSKPLAYHF